MEPDHRKFRSTLEKKIKQDYQERKEQLNSTLSSLDPKDHEQIEQKIDLLHKQYARGINEALEYYCTNNNITYKEIETLTLKQKNETRNF